MSKRLLTLLVLGCALVLTVSGVLAQPSLEETYVADSGSYQFSYPADWTLNINEENGLVSVSGDLEGDIITVIFLDPDGFASLTGDAADTEEAATLITSDSSLADIFVGDPQLTTLSEERDAALVSVDLNGSDGVAFIVPIADSWGGMIIFADESTDTIIDNAEFFFAMADTFNEVVEETSSGNGGLGGLLGGSNNDEEEEETSGGLGGLLGGSSSSNSSNQTTESDTVTSLDNVDGDYRDAIAELQDVGLIGSGGSLVFQESRAFFDSEGYFFQPLASRSPRTDIVMSATLDFSTSGSADAETCTLLARIEDNASSTVTTYLQVGFDSDGGVYYYDAREGEDGDFNYVEANLDLDESHHLLFIAADDTVTVFVDGQLVFDAQPVQERSGYYGLALRGRGADARCEGTNIWVYEAPAYQPGVCEVYASGTVNLRSGPGTNFDRAGTLSAGQSFEVVGQAAGSDGFTWYELENDAWVREDIITLQGDCADIPDSE